ncbi:MAG: hypothetical protein WAX38_03555 [Minisyncoccia bacterium]
MGNPEGGGYNRKLDVEGERNAFLTDAYEKSYSRALREHHPEIGKTIEYIRQSIDWEILMPLLIARLRDAGVPEERFNLGPLTSEMPARPTDDYAAVYNAISNTVGFSSFDDNFMAAVRLLKKNGSLPRLLTMKIQLVMIHEICHALSENTIKSQSVNKNQVRMSGKSGFSQVFDITEKTKRGNEKKRQPIKFYEALNEAVTQRLAEEIMVEYSRIAEVKHGEHFVASFIEKMSKRLWSYTIFANQLDNICKRVAEQSGKTQEEIWRNFKRAYFKNPESFIAETQAVLENIYGQDFWKKYQRFGNGESMQGIGAFDSEHEFLHPRTYPERWLAQLGIAKNT